MLSPFFTFCRLDGMPGGARGVVDGGEESLRDLSRWLVLFLRNLGLDLNVLILSNRTRACRGREAFTPPFDPCMYSMYSMHARNACARPDSHMIQNSDSCMHMRGKSYM